MRERAGWAIKIQFTGKGGPDLPLPVSAVGNLLRKAQAGDRKATGAQDCGDSHVLPGPLSGLRNMFISPQKSLRKVAQDRTLAIQE